MRINTTNSNKKTQEKGDSRKFEEMTRRGSGIQQTATRARDPAPRAHTGRATGHTGPGPTQPRTRPVRVRPRGGRRRSSANGLCSGQAAQGEQRCGHERPAHAWSPTADTDDLLSATARGDGWLRSLGLYGELEWTFYDFFFQKGAFLI